MPLGVDAQDRTMTFIVKCQIALLILSCAASPAHAGRCADAIARTQALLARAIEKDADSRGWLPEGLDALRNHQPTPRSLAAAEGSTGFTDALDSLDRARGADRDGDHAACSEEIAQARAILR
jgi:hypothetical protein